MDHAVWREGTYVVIAVQAVGQTWEVEENGDGTVLLKSLLGRNTRQSGELYLGYTDVQHDPNEGPVRWAVLRPKNKAAKIAFFLRQLMEASGARKGLWSAKIPSDPLMAGR